MIKIQFTKKIIILIVYIALISFGAYHHEPWRDEGHAWLIARDTSISELLKNTHHMGTPLLWYVLLMPFAKSGLPYFSMTIVHVILAGLAGCLLLFFGKIPLQVKVLFLFSYYMAFEYAVIARLYVLIVLILFSIAALYPKRFTHPTWYAVLVFLLFQVNSFSIMPALLISILFGIQLSIRRKTFLRGWVALGIMLAGGLLSFLQLYPSPSSTGSPTNTIAEIPLVIREALVPASLLLTPNQSINQILMTLLLILTCILFIVFVAMVAKIPSVLVFSLAAGGWWVYVNSVVHKGTLRHHGLFLIFLIFSWWIFRAESENGKKLPKSKLAILFISVLSFLLIISTVVTAKMYYLDYRFPFSSGKDMANYIKNNGLDRESIVAFVGSHSEAVLPYLPGTKFWYPELETYGSFIMPTTAHMTASLTLSNADVLSKIKRHFPDQTPVLFLLTSPFSEKESTGYTMVYHTGAWYFWSNETESFWLYRRV